MVPFANISRLIGQFYDTILEARAWAPALAEFCQMMDAKAASIHTFNPMEGRVGLYIEHGCDPAFTKSLFSTYAAMTPTGASIFLAEIDEPMSVFDFIDEDEFRASRFYQEWCAPQGYYDMLGTLISKQPREVGALSATRLECQPRFNFQDKALMALLVPHVRRAVKIAGLLENRVHDIDQLLDVIDQLDSAVIIVNAAGKILRTNTAGRAAVAAGAILQACDGNISASDGDLLHNLKSALENIAPEPSTFAVPGANGGPKLIAVMPLGKNRGEFAIFLKSEDPDIPAIGRHLVAAFKLTPREVGVLMPLLEGHSPMEVGQRLGIGMATVRTHLHRLFSKTGTGSQPELISLILKAMPPVKLG